MGHFYFVRHGQTVWNVENKICGATDIALTEQGHEQAIETGKKILAEGIQADEILYSPLQIAADTAKHISEITGIPARVEPRLRSRISENGSPHREMEWILSLRNSPLPAAMRAESPCSALRRESIICWTISRQNPMRKLIF